MPRFVILEHDFPTPHWDLMLEAGSVLRTWRLAQPPRPGEVIDALAVFDHRLLYLNYEGPLSGDRGRVVRWERGTFTKQFESERRLVLQVEGECLRGVLVLEHAEGDTWHGAYHSSATANS